jgi:hypothetical protein
VRCLKEAEFGVGNDECVLGGEKCDKVGTDEKEEMGEFQRYFSVVCRCWSGYFLTERCAL